MRLSSSALVVLLSALSGSLFGSVTACGTEAASTFGPDKKDDPLAAGSGAAIPEGAFGTDGRERDGGESSACDPSLVGVLRDFRGKNEPGGHPDFEAFMNVDDHTMVADRLGADGKPVYAGKPTTPASNGKTAYDAWWRDTAGVNLSERFTLPALVDPGTGRTTFDSTAFFPLDGKGFGNTPKFEHNYHFTYELHTEFAYRGGETFAFRGDDDVWVFIAGQKVVDLGGVHQTQGTSIDLDALAGRLGIRVGETYPLDFFFAERHTVESNFRFETTLHFTNCAPILK